MGKPESHYRDLLAGQVNGRTEVMLPLGRADVMTSTHVFEVEPAATWRHGAAQALQYAAQCGQQGVLALYGSPRDLEAIWSTLRRVPLELWWFAGEEFIHLETAEQMLDCLPGEPEPVSVPASGSPRERPPTRAEAIASAGAVFAAALQELNADQRFGT